jgi:hypothetical protein
VLRTFDKELLAVGEEFGTFDRDCWYGLDRWDGEGCNESKLAQKHFADIQQLMVIYCNQH